MNNSGTSSPWINESTPRARPQADAFSLVELLVVIGIIALLVGILLPVLSEARRSAKSVKCLAAQREIGNGFSLYAADFNSTWPAAHDDVDSFMGGDATKIRRWTDRVGPYITSGEVQELADVDEVRRESVLWGCPEWSKSQIFEPPPPSTPNVFVLRAEDMEVGYGMNPFPGGLSWSPQDMQSWAWTGAGGRYPKVVHYTQPSIRALILDSGPDMIWASDDAWTDSMNLWGFDFQFVDYFATPLLSVDGARHAPPSESEKQDVLRERYLNILYADGHAASASVVEAHAAVRIPQ